MRESEEIEGLRSAFPPCSAVHHRESAELDEARLVGVQIKRELAQALLEVAEKLFCIFLALATNDEVSRPGESHPRALAELYVNVSAHTAPIIHPPASPPADANGRTAGARDEQGHRASDWLDGDVAVASCISACPSNQQAIEVAKDRIQGRFVETAVVLNPPSKDRIPHAGQVVDGLVASPRKVPTSHRLSHPRRCRIAHRRREVDEVLTPPILRPTRAKRVPQEGELLRGILPRPVVILAVDDVRLLRMDLQPALRQTTFDVRQDLLRLRLRPTVHDDIIRVPLERNVRVRPSQASTVHAVPCNVRTARKRRMRSLIRRQPA